MIPPPTATKAITILRIPALWNEGGPEATLPAAALEVAALALPEAVALVLVLCEVAVEL
jgi:hypothetical protein